MTTTKKFSHPIDLCPTRKGDDVSVGGTKHHPHVDDSVNTLETVATTSFTSETPLHLHLMHSIDDEDDEEEAVYDCEDRRRTATTTITANKTTASNGNSSNKIKKKKRVRFHTVHVRQYPIEIGSCSVPKKGPPIGIGWEYCNESTCNIYEYERLSLQTKHNNSYEPFYHLFSAVPPSSATRRTCNDNDSDDSQLDNSLEDDYLFLDDDSHGDGMWLSMSRRIELLQNQGFTMSEIMSSSQECRHIRHERTVSAKRNKVHDRWDLALERMKKKLQKLKKNKKNNKKRSNNKKQQQSSTKYSSEPNPAPCLVVVEY